MIREGIAGYILRPLSGRHLDPTIPELKGCVDPNKLLPISGRSRKIQISLTAEKVFVIILSRRLPADR